MSKAKGFLLAVAAAATAFTVSCFPDGGSESIGICGGKEYDTTLGYICERGELIGYCKGKPYYMDYQSCENGKIEERTAPSSSSNGNLLPSSSSSAGETPSSNLDVLVVDIGEGTEWNYMIAAKDGSSMFIDVNESNDMPARVFLKPSKNSNDGAAIFFKENGLPDKMVVDGHILYYGNFNGYKYDLAVIYPDNRIEYHYDVETDVNWDDYAAGPGFAGKRSLFKTNSIGALKWFDKFDTWFLSPVLTGIACAVGNWFDCGLGIFSTTGNIILEIIDATCKSCNTETAHFALDALDCASFFSGGEWESMLDMLGAPGVLNACVSAAEALTSRLLNQAHNLTNEKIQQINEAVRKIDGDVLTEIPRELLELFLDLGITINSGRNPPNIEGAYFVPTLTLMRNTVGGGIATQWDKQVTFSGQNDNKLTINVDYTLPSDNGSFSLSGLGYIVGSGNKYTVIVNGTREAQGHTAKTVEAFSGEITAAGIKDYQWGVFMIDDGGDPLGTWISNGTGYSKSGTAVKFDPNQPGLANNPIPLTADIWTDGSIASGGFNETWYSFNVVSGTSYSVWWNDSYAGNGSHTLDILASAQYENGTSIFSGVDNAYSSPKTFTANQTGIVKIRVYPYSSGKTGTYALTYSIGSTATRP